MAGSIHQEPVILHHSERVRLRVYSIDNNEENPPFLMDILRKRTAWDVTASLKAACSSGDAVMPLFALISSQTHCT